MTDTGKGEKIFSKKEFFQIGKLTAAAILLSSCIKKESKEKNNKQCHILKIEDGDTIQYPDNTPIQNIIIRYPHVPRGANPKLGKMRYRHNNDTPPVIIDLKNSIESLNPNRKKPIERQYGELLSTDLFHIQEIDPQASPTLIWEAAGQKSRITKDNIENSKNWVAIPILVPFYEGGFSKNSPIETVIIKQMGKSPTEQQATIGLAVGKTAISGDNLLIDLVGYIHTDAVKLTPFKPVT